MKTKLRILLASLLILTLTISAQARLGETYEQCVTRYGAPTEKLPADPNEMSGVETYRFKSDKWGLGITFWKGKAYSILYYMLDRSTPNFAQAEIETILKLNIPDVK